MLDFLRIATRTKQGVTEIFPKFVMGKSSDLMIRGRDFYAIWVEELGLWSTDEQAAIQLIDKELDKFSEEYKRTHETMVRTLYMWDSDTGMIDKWHKYCQKQCRDNFHMLDENLIFSNTETTKKDYASKRLTYPIEPGPCPAWDLLIGTLYSEEERAKIEWAIGAIITGDSKTIQKFMVLYGSAGTGKSTILNVIQQLFDGYYSVFDAKALGSSSNSFALEAFNTNPLVAIQHDGDLSKIEDNTRLNSLVSHELMTINEKFKSTYSNRFKCFLFMGTNKPVKITDAKSGIIRRLIDVHPSGNKLNTRDYTKAVKQVSFELGAIANHCKEVYLSDPSKYDDYIPIEMFGATNDFYDFVLSSMRVFRDRDEVTAKAAWEMYRTYCEDANVPYPMSLRIFKEELKNYFKECNKGIYKGFRIDKFEIEKKPGGKIEKNKPKSWIKFLKQESIFDKELCNCPAQYANDAETPSVKWVKCKSILKDIDTSKLHYVKVPENHIVIDFDIKGDDGSKSFEKNLEAASKWPATYAELSKSGAGIHLHYIYTGDPSKLSRVYDENIEIKVFSGKSSLRRMLTKCNDISIATISSGLPLKGEKMINTNVVQTEKGLRTTIKKCLNKEIHPGTKPSCDFIYKILEDAYNSGIHYDVSDMQNAIFAFAAGSTNKSDYCIDLVNKMKFKSEDAAFSVDNEDSELVFYDIEVFPNLFLVNFKIAGEGKPVVRLINPTPNDIEDLIKFRLVGFNCRRYDNHLLYARLMGYTNEELYKLSQKIINTPKGENNKYLFGEAYNISYTDVYDFASAGNKKSLKKLEIEMGSISEETLKKHGFSDYEIRIIKAGTHHQELGLPWDQPVPEELWTKVAEYCDNDVIATEAAFIYLKADWTARQILADLAGGSYNDTTNALTTKFIFGNNKKPQNELRWRDLSKPVHDIDEETYEFLSEACPEMMTQTHGEAGSYLPYFPGYKYEFGVSTYKDFNPDNPNPLYRKVGEGGCVYSEPGMYGNVALLDIASQHPHSAIAEIVFGVRYTKAFRDIVEGRVNIKHKAWDEVNTMLDGKLAPYVEKVKNGEMSSKDLANALKTAINSVYGLTSASFDNAFRHPDNKDNIVAKRGALFMIDLKEEVQKRGFTVAHIKTDSIKIPDANPEIIKFVMDFGKKYGYTFEHEATYEKMCLVNKAVYIAKYATAESCQNLYGYIPGDNADYGGQWTATGDQFAVPYVHKTLFTHEPIIFNDLCNTFEVKKGSLHLDMNENLPDVSTEEKELEKLETQYKKGKISDITFEEGCVSLNETIEKGHDLRFVGRIGQFCPVKPGSGGGILYRVDNGKNYAAPGSTGFRWLESEIVKNVNEDSIDLTFYNKLVDDAVDTINEYGDFEWFVSDDPYIPKEHDYMYIPDGIDEKEGIPFV